MYLRAERLPPLAPPLDINTGNGKEVIQAPKRSAHVKICYTSQKGELICVQVFKNGEQCFGTNLRGYCGWFRLV